MISRRSISCTVPGSSCHLSICTWSIKVSIYCRCSIISQRFYEISGIIFFESNWPMLCYIWYNWSSYTLHARDNYITIRNLRIVCSTKFINCFWQCTICILESMFSNFVVSQIKAGGNSNRLV